MVRACILAASLSLGAAPTLDGPIDAYFEGEWKKLNLKASPPCDDTTFLRRVSLDLTGTLPDPEAVRAFLKSTKKDKRQAKIDELMASPGAADYFAHLWVQWLMGHDVDQQDFQRIDFGALIRWLRQAWEKDLPYSDMVRAFISTTGNVRENPPAAFLVKHLSPGDPPAALAGASARLFLGKDIRCAQCHDHPFQKITQEEFWGYAAFFRPLQLRDGAVAEGAVGKPAKLRDDMGEIFAEPRFLDGRAPEADETRGQAVARLILSMEGDVPAQAAVDRMWKLYFGRPLAPVKTSKGRPELLQRLVQEFTREKGSLRKLARMIISSRVYQQSSEGADAVRREYAAGPLKMMNSVQYMKAWNFAFQWETYFRQLYKEDPRKAPFFRDPDAFWIVQTMHAKEMIFPKGRDPEEVLASGTDRLALKLMNNRDFQLLMIAQFGLVRRVMNNMEDPGRRIEELFFYLVGRPPTKTEKSELVSYVKGIANPYHAYTDIFWMLFNSSEFIFVG